jgi:hypothetical protein
LDLATVRTHEINHSFTILRSFDRRETALAIHVYVRDAFGDNLGCAALGCPLADEDNDARLQQVQPATEVFREAHVTEVLAWRAIISCAAAHYVEVGNVTQREPTFAQREVISVNGPLRNEVFEDNSKFLVALGYGFVSQRAKRCCVLQVLNGAASLPNAWVLPNKQNSTLVVVRANVTGLRHMLCMVAKEVAVC